MKKTTLDNLLAWNPVTELLEDSQGPLPFKSVRRSDNGDYLATVGKDRTVIDNRAIVEDCIEFANAANASVDGATAFECKGGASIRIDFKMPETVINGDQILTSVRFVASHDSSVRRFAMINFERLACLNIYFAPVVDRGLFAKFSKNHSCNWQSRKGEFGERFFDSLNKSKRIIEALHEKTVSAQKARAVVQKLYGGSGKRSENTREQVLDLFTSGRGNAGKTGWDLFNGITEYENHHKSFKETSGTSREENRFVGLESLDLVSLSKVIL